MIDKEEEVVDIACEIRHETAKAWLIYDEETDTECWVPKSQCEWDENNDRMRIPMWLAVVKELV